MRRTTQTRPLTLFEQVLFRKDQDQEEEDKKMIKVSTKNQNQQGVQNTKSLHNLNDIFYSNHLDYKDFKQSLRYNNKNLKKIALENIKNPHPKIIKNIVKHNLSGLIELKLKDIDITDSKFELFAKKGGLSQCFQSLTILILNCPSMTSASLPFLFQEKQQLQFLDLSSTQIDNVGIYHISRLQWPKLETLILQWCTKITRLDDLGYNASNFPSLRIIDSRFIKTENEAYEVLINSGIVTTLNSLRLFGTNTDLDCTQWRSSYLLQLFMDTMRGLNIQEFRIQNESSSKKSTDDYKQMKVITNINTDTQKKQINVSWKIDPLCTLLQFIETVESQSKKFINFGKLFEFLSKEWQLRKSLKILQLMFDMVVCDEINMDIILKTIVDFKELKKLKLYIQNQQYLKPVTYFYVFNQIGELNQLLYLQLDLSNNKLEINQIFLQKIYRSIQQLPYLNLLYLNISDNKVMNVQDLYQFNYQIITSIKNPYLSHIYLRETKDQNLNYEYKDAVNLYYNDYLKTISINQEELLIEEEGNRLKGAGFRKITHDYHKKRKMLMNNLDKKSQMKYQNLLQMNDLDQDDVANKFSDFYEYEKLLGSGGFGKVVQAINIKGESVAVKIIPKRECKRSYSEILAEASILSQMRHPNIVQFKRVLETDTKLLLEMALVRYGQLRRLFIDKVELSYEQKRSLMQTIFKTVAFIHERGVVHRDLKPEVSCICILENILLEDCNDMTTLKIVDFGLSTRSQLLISGQCGTLIYMAPEFFTRQVYSKPVDIWSCGIILYMVCTGGKHPLYISGQTADDYKEKLYNHLLNPLWEFPEDFDPLAKNLFLKCVAEDPMHRYSAHQILHHPWITGKTDDPIPLSLPEMYRSFSMRERVIQIIKALMLIRMMSQDYWRCKNVKKLEVEYLEKCKEISTQQQKYHPQSLLDKSYVKEMMAEHALIKTRQHHHHHRVETPKYQSILKRLIEPSRNLPDSYIEQGSQVIDDNMQYQYNSINNNQQTDGSQRSISQQSNQDIQECGETNSGKLIIIKKNNQNKKKTKKIVQFITSKKQHNSSLDLQVLRSRSTTANNPKQPNVTENKHFESPKKQQLGALKELQPQSSQPQLLPPSGQVPQIPFLNTVTQFNQLKPLPSNQSPVHRISNHNYNGGTTPSVHNFANQNIEQTPQVYGYVRKTSIINNEPKVIEPPRKRSHTSTRKLSVVELDCHDQYKYEQQDKVVHNQFLPRGWCKTLPFQKFLPQKQAQVLPQYIELNALRQQIKIPLPIQLQVPKKK